jgi:tripartite-type tricarboxylate transporter receptor subunit TctC
MTVLRWWIAALLLVLIAPAGFAQNAYPRQPIVMIVPFEAGTAIDRIARAGAAALGKQLGQPVSVDNRGDDIRQARPDGYTLLFSISEKAGAPLHPDAAEARNDFVALDTWASYVGGDGVRSIGVFAPRNTPSAVADKLKNAVLRAMNDPDVEQALFAAGLQPRVYTSEEEVYRPYR